MGITSRKNSYVQSVKEETVELEKRGEAHDVLSSSWRFAALSSFLHTYHAVFKYPEFLTEELEDLFIQPERYADLVELNKRLLKFSTANRLAIGEGWQEYLCREFAKKYDPTEHEGLPSPLPPPRYDDEGFILDYYSDLDLKARLHIMVCLCDWQLHNSSIDRFRRSVNAASPYPEVPEEDEVQWRINPLGQDAEGSVYYTFPDDRLYKQVFAANYIPSGKTSPPRRAASSNSVREPNLMNLKFDWVLVCRTEPEWRQFMTDLYDTENSPQLELYKKLVREVFPAVQLSFKRRSKLRKIAFSSDPTQQAVASKLSKILHDDSLSLSRRDSSDFLPDLYLRRSERGLARKTADLKEQEQRAAEQVAAKLSKPESIQKVYASTASYLDPIMTVPLDKGRSREQRILEREQRIMEQQIKQAQEESAVEAVGDEPMQSSGINPSHSSISGNLSTVTVSRRISIDKKDTKPPPSSIPKQSSLPRPPKKRKSGLSTSSSAESIPRAVKSNAITISHSAIISDAPADAPTEGGGEETYWMFKCPCGIERECYDDGTMLVSCSDCQVWAHTSCIANTQIQAPALWQDYVCTECIRDKEKMALDALLSPMGFSRTPTSQ